MANKNKNEGRKVFISVLGTSAYGKCFYTDESFKSSYTRFIQQATLEYHNAKDWDSSSIGYIMVTPKAYNENWLTTEGKTDRFSVEYIGLERSIEEMKLPFPIDTLAIEEGKNEMEIMNIFLKVYEELEENDNLYIDITHGFRYLPMLVLVLTNYAKFIKNVKCVSITYGNYETRVNINGKDEAPIISLKSLSLLQDWTDATEHFFYSGNTEKMSELCKEEIKISKGTNEKYKALKKLVSPLETITDDMKTCQGGNIISGKHFAVLSRQLEEVKSQNLPAEFLPILKKISSEFSSFDSTENWKNGLYAAQWCFAHQQYQQAITMLRETIVTGTCIRFGLDWTLEEDRNIISNVIPTIGKLYAAVKADKNHSEDTDTKDLILEKLGNEKYLKDKEITLSIFEKRIALDIIEDKTLLELSNIYYEGRSARNQYNHAGMLRKTTQRPHFESSALIEQIENRIVQINDWMKPSTLFINFSNHPSTRWEEKQLSAAKEYGEIADLSFPSIQENDSKVDITQLVKVYLKQIEKLSDHTPCVVHIMGEMTFTYAMVNALKAKGYTCVASTTKRIVDEGADGTKNVKFEFCKFREY